MEKVFCANCGYVFGQEGEGRSTWEIMRDVEEEHQYCPKCSMPLTVGVHEDPDEIVAVLSGERGAVIHLEEGEDINEAIMRGLTAQIRAERQKKKRWWEFWR